VHDLSIMADQSRCPTGEEKQESSRPQGQAARLVQAQGQRCLYLGPRRVAQAAGYHHQQPPEGDRLSMKTVMRYWLAGAR
jgi:hypothetical protein